MHSFYEILLFLENYSVFRIFQYFEIFPKSDPFERRQNLCIALLGLTCLNSYKVICLGAFTILGISYITVMAT